MCGLVAVAQTNQKPIDEMAVRAMTNSLAHRGPDDEGFYFSQHVAFGFRRLAILDLSLNGHQPMCTYDEKIWIIFNGEIYNYLELREELCNIGYVFRSGSDTEVILAAYQEWGTDCLNRFNGMWGLCIWDERNQQLFCARDRMGIKPLYYWWDQQTLVIASEIKAFLQWPGFHPKLNTQTAIEFLAMGLTDHTAETFWADVFQLLPGHYLTFNPTTAALHIQPYWQLSGREISGNLSFDEATEQFSELFVNAVHLRLRSDVPVGSCLSGGLDSSAIVCTINQFLRSQQHNIGERQKTFTAVFQNPQLNERPYAEYVLGQTNAAGYFIEPDGQSFWKELPKVIYHQDQPFHTTSVYAQWNVMRLAANNNVTVILDGQGADELLAGYTVYIGVFLAQLLLQGKIGLFLHTFKNFLAKTDLGYKGLLRVTGRGWGRGLQGDAKSMFQKTFRQGPSWVQTALTKTHPFTENGYHHDLHSILQADLTRYNLPALLRYEDRNSMAFSLEARLPFLDYRLVEFVASLPDHIKLHKGQTKSILRSAMENRIPTPILERRDKMGFITPQQQWLEEGRTNILSLFERDCRSTSLIEYQKILTRLREEKPFSSMEVTTLWRFICFEQWLRTFNISPEI